MPSRFAPQNVKDDFYNKFQTPKNYKTLKIKVNKTTKDLKDIFNNNVWNLKDKALKLQQVTKAENNEFYNSWLNEVYLLDFIKVPKMKNINKNDFFNLKYKTEGNTDRTETNNVSHFKTWINNFFPEQVKLNNLNWFCTNQNEILLKLMMARNEKNNALETLRKDINLLLHFLKIADAGEEIINKYKVLNLALSKINDIKEGENKLNDDREDKAFINYEELLKLRNNLYTEWAEEFDNTPLNKYKNPLLRIKNITSLLVSFYVLFPPLRLEAMNLKIVDNEQEAEENEYSIYIKDNNNIWVYLNSKKKFHKPIKYNLNDDLIKSFSKKNVDTLIENIIESVETYPRKYLFISSNGKQYTEKSLQKILYELVPNKNLGVNSFRSSYASYYVPKLNKNQLQRVAFLMRSSVSMLMSNYLKKDSNNNVLLNDFEEAEPEQEQETKNIINTTTNNKEKIKTPRNRTQYFKNYYEGNKEKILNANKENDKKTYNLRYVR